MGCSAMELADRLPEIGQHLGKLQVKLSNQIIHLLSEQMYSSPLKAVEELVVNSSMLMLESAGLAFQ